MSKIQSLETQIAEINKKALDVTNLKNDFISYKNNDIEITKKINDKIIMFGSQILEILNQQAQLKTKVETLQQVESITKELEALKIVVDSLNTDVKHIKAELLI